MTDTGSVAPAAPAESSLLFGFRGSIGRGKYWIGLGVVAMLVVGMFGFGSNAMNSTGGGGLALFAIPCLLAAIWIYAAITVKRLRDTSVPAGTFPLFIIAPFIFSPVALEYGEHLTYLIVPAQLVLFILPGLLPPKPRDLATPST